METNSNGNNHLRKKEYEKLVRDIVNVASALGMYPPEHPMVTRRLDSLYREMGEIFKNNQLISIHRGEGTFVVNDVEFLANDPVIEKVSRHFNNFKITDLEIGPGLKPDELKRFLNLLSRSEQNAKLYPNLNAACQKNQIASIKAMQAAYIRVAKDVKDKLGGKSVGELKLSKDEMNRLIGYLKGEVKLAHPKETKIYKKIFENAGMLSGLVNKIIAESSKEPADKRKKIVLMVLNQIGRYLIQQSTSGSQQKESLKVLLNLKKTLANSELFVALGNGDSSFKNEVEEAMEKTKLLVKNQALLAEYSKHKDKLKEVKEKIQKISPQLLKGELDSAEEGGRPEMEKLLLEIKGFLEKIERQKSMAPDDLRKIPPLVKEIKKYL